MDNETKISVKFSNSVTGAKKLDTYLQKLKEIYAILEAIDKGKMAELGEFNITISKTKGNVQDLDKETTKFKKNFNTIFSIGKITIFGKKLYNLVKTFGSLTNKSAEYIENINLLEVAYSNVNKETGEFNEDIETTSKRIESLVSKMADVYGLDESRLARSFGIFKQLSNAMELPVETGEQLSELMVKMTNDIASLYNLKLDRASNALQSALAGQVRPIRSATGADITEKTLQKTVENLELDRTISQLSFVEKRLVMVVSLTEQLKKSQGDYGRTIESVANQVRVMHEQWDRLSRAVGNVFYPLMKSIMPVVNGVLMALTEIFNIIAELVGFKMDDFDYSGLAGASDSALDLEENLNGASASADKLKNKMSGLRNFDKLNVISTPKNSGSSGVGSANGSIDPKILDAFSKAFADYDDMLDKVKMKARDIRDSIMQWLGFTKEIDPLTGEVKWKYQGIGKFLQNIFTSFKNMSPFMKIVTTGITTLIAVKTVNGISKLADIFGNKTGLAKAIKQVNDEDVFGLLSAGTKFKDSIELWSKSQSKVQKFTNALIGAGGLVLSLNLVKDSMKNLATTSDNVALDVGKSFAGILGSAGSLAYGLGAVFGPGGAIAGAIIGGLMGIITAWDTFSTYANTNLKDIEEHGKEIKATYDDLIETNKTLNEQYKVSNAHTTYYEALYSELQDIVDENGKIKKGYEDRAKVITGELASALGIEINIVDGVIEKYNELKTSIEQLIIKKEALARLNALEEAHEEAIKKMPEARKKESIAYQDLIKAQQNLNSMLDKEAEKLGVSRESLEKYYKTGKMNNEVKSAWIKLGAVDRNNLSKSYYEYAQLNYVLKEAETNYKTASDTLDGYIKIEEDWKEMTKLATQENYEEMKEYFDHTSALYGKDIDEQRKYWEQNIDDNKRYLEDLQRNRDKYSESQYEALKKRYNDEIDLSNQKLTELKIAMIKDISEIDDEVVDYFYNMGEKSTDKFIEKVSELPQDFQDEVISKMREKGFQITEEIQKGLNDKKLEKELEVKAKMDKAKNDINNLINNVNSGIGKMLGINIPNIKLFAKGGFPEKGNLFIMNENEPELLGNIGGKSFVANQNQMMDLLDKKIGNAQSKPINATFVIQVGDKELARQVINDLQNIAKTDGKPITIGG